MALSPEDERELHRCFAYHAPDADDRVKYEAITAKTRELAALIMELCPVGADRSAALRQLRETRMTANASIACKPSPC